MDLADLFKSSVFSGNLDLAAALTKKSHGIASVSGNLLEKIQMKASIAFARVSADVQVKTP